jgi:hypothetical protein
MKVIEEDDFERGTMSTKLPIGPLEPIERNLDER